MEFPCTCMFYGKQNRLCLSIILIDRTYTQLPLLFLTGDRGRIKISAVTVQRTFPRKIRTLAEGSRHLSQHETGNGARI